MGDKDDKNNDIEDLNIPFQEAVYTNKKTGFQIKIDEETSDYFSNNADLLAKFKKVAIKDNQDVNDEYILERIKKVVQLFRDKEINNERAIELIKNECSRQGSGIKGTSKNTKLTPKKGSI
jgi:hypothetical protein